MTAKIIQTPLPRVPAVQLAHVSKRFGLGAPIINDLSVVVAPGEFVSIIGPSGCGKSTILKLIAGLTHVSSGEISIEGMTPVNAREIMSFIFQDPTLLPWRTVRANIGLGLELEHATKERHETKVNALLEIVGLSHVADSYPRQLSGGMKMRVSIARALASNPGILLLDEPFAALDEITRDHMNEELLRLQREQGWTVIFVTHSVAEAVFLSTRILVLASHPGRLVHDISIALPTERNAATRRSEVYESLVSSTSRILREAITL
jgi:NitT/TauT family transport system ATP-binding protein